MHKEKLDRKDKTEQLEQQVLKENKEKQDHKDKMDKTALQDKMEQKVLLVSKENKDLKETLEKTVKMVLKEHKETPGLRDQLVQLGHKVKLDW